MADFTQSPYGGVAPHVQSQYAVGSSNPLTKVTNLAGAAISLALVVGVGIWGYKLLVRDVSGIPVVRAAAGEMRVRPEEPGGQLARNQGLSVNTVAVVGAEDSHAERLQLAPKPIELAEDDDPVMIPQDVAAPAPTAPEELQEAAIVQDVAAALESGSVEDLVAQLTNGIAPMDPLSGENAPVHASLSSNQVPELLSGEGMRVSLRPSLRPKRAARAIPAAATAPSSSNALEVDASSLPVGTRLVQLGAFDSPEIARAQWRQLNARFAPFMEGKKRVVMEAKSGGRTFYRLRAQGFDDIGDARRFCSALLAESVDCIPVVTR